MDLRHRRRVRHRYIGRQKCRQIRDAFQASHRQQPPDHPLDQGILRIAVHHPQPRPPLAYTNLTAHHIEIAPYAQQVVQLRRPGVKVHHMHPPPVFPIMGISGGDYAKRCAPRRGTHLFYHRNIFGPAGAGKRGRPDVPAHLPPFSRCCKGYLSPPVCKTAVPPRQNHGSDP